MLTKRKNRVGALSKGYLERHFKGAKALDSSSPNYLSSLILADTRRDPERPWEYNSEDEKEGSDDEEHLKGDSFFLLSMRELPTLLPNQGKVVFPTVRKRMYDLCQTGMQLEIKHNRLYHQALHIHSICQEAEKDRNDLRNRVLELEATPSSFSDNPRRMIKQNSMHTFRSATKKSLP